MAKRNKSAKIREILAEKPEASAKEIVELLATKRIKVNPAQVYKVKSESKPAGETDSNITQDSTPKTATEKSKAKPDNKAKKGRSKSRPYPQRGLAEALTVPKAIREINNGRPMDTEQVAKALGTAKSNNKFFYVAAASRDYGLTAGSRDTDTIELSPLGTEIFFAKDEATKKQKMIDSFMSVDLFKKVYDYYGGSKAVPTTGDFFSNVLLKEFKLDPDFHGEFETIFRENCKFLGIEDGLTAVASEKAKKKETVTDDIRVVGAAKGKFDRTAFVIMPFWERGPNARPAGFFEQVLNSIIVPAGNTAGFSVETAQQKGSDVIHTTIINRLLEADLVIADLSDHNPNVLFELGIRLAHEKPVALIRATGTERIFDVDIIRVEDYNPNIWPTTVEKDIPKIADHVKATWDNRDSRRPYMEILTGRTQAKS